MTPTPPTVKVARQHVKPAPMLVLETARCRSSLQNDRRSLWASCPRDQRPEGIDGVARRVKLMPGRRTGQAVHRRPCTDRRPARCHRFATSHRLPNRGFAVVGWGMRLWRIFRLFRLGVKPREQLIPAPAGLTVSVVTRAP
jgi:hypothetical protein